MSDFVGRELDKILIMHIIMNILLYVHFMQMSCAGERPDTMYERYSDGSP